jgi:iron-sulfur cluster repair protein YtfE (RIC family)
MDYQGILANLFQEEDSARHMARQLMETANESREAAARERKSLLEFLHGAMERHMEYEERSLFPKLVTRGLAAEVSVAEKQHAALREGRTKLGEIPEAEAGTRGAEIAQLIFDIARLMLHHTNFEGDYIYPELDQEDWRELMEETIH